ncbi:uncharacterized protein LOC119647912 isoform X2 [Hermetia illucens]|uniref:uncharacterized protein LOC119647912 isoform X2 n=1 Tax=Hermetia illucens TaxID=343691 RepID=UPI0018CC663E|nr:uncharacterized protein LOC119647912 isoform X2 [Hermetia illucens]
MISTKIIFVSCWSLLLVFSSVYAIYDPNDGVKTKTFRRGQGPSEPIVMHHQYSQVSSNRPQESGYSQSQFDARQGRTSYTNEAENYVAQYGSECPPNATGQYPYILNCRQFLNCWKGRGYIQSCAPGTVFNPDTRECDNPEKVICLNYRSESNPNNHFARLQQVQTKSYSDSPSPTSSHPPRNIGDDVQCAPGSSGVQPHPFDCAKFLNCANGITYIQVCGPGTVFNSVSLVCDFPYNVDCSSRSGGSTGSQGADSTNDYGQQHHTQGHYGGGFHNHRHHSWPSSSQGTTSSTDNINGRDSTFAGLSPGYGSSATTPSTSKHQYDQSGSGSSSFSHDQIAQASQSRNYDQESSRTYHQTQNYPHRHHYHHHRPGGYRRHFQSQSGQQGLEYSTTSQGNRNPKLDWDQSTNVDEQENQQAWQRPSLNASPSNPSFTIDQAKVHEMTPPGSSGIFGNNKTTIYYAQPVGTFDISDTDDLQQKEVPSPFLEPPKRPSKPSRGQQDSASGRTTIYYAQPMGTYDLNNFNMTNGHSSGTPVWKPMRPSTVNKTIVYATPVGDFHHDQNFDSEIDEGQKSVPLNEHFSSQSHVPLGFPSPPSTHQNNSWSSSTGGQFIPSSYHQHSVVQSTNDRAVYDESNLYGGLQPPHAPTQPSKPTHLYSTPPNRLEPPSPEMVPPTVPLVPVPFGDLLPPMLDPQTTNLPIRPPHNPVLNPPPEPTKPLITNHTRQDRVYQMYPPISSDVNPRVNITSSTLYSPSYSSVTHTKSSSGNKDTKLVDEEEAYRKVIPIYTRPTSQTTGSTRSSTNLPPAYNHQYYNPPQAQITDSGHLKPLGHGNQEGEPKELPISEALKMLLRPYFNRSGTVTDDVADNMNEHIMKLSSASSPKEMPKQPTRKLQTDSEAEIIFSGEQANLNEGTQHHYYDSFENSGENTTEQTTYQGGARYRHHHHFHHHRHHPGCNHTHHQHQHHHHHHRHSWNHHNHTFHHSREFHRNHPEIHNPFATNDLGESETPDKREGHIDTRINNRDDSAGGTYPELDADKPACQFDCKNGKCISEYQVCDGVNNCGNRLDEKQCDHIGYEVRLSSDEGKANMGRVEVKANGKWGYVCDDKFGMRAADVLCKELGFSLGASEVRGNSYYPAHKEMYDELGVRYLMDEVDCLGNETSIRECNFKGWGVHDCSPEEVVGVVCKIPVMTCPANYWLCKTSQECVAIGFLCDSVPDCQDGSDESDDICNEAIQYRLENGPNEMEGRVEVKYRDSWGTICDDDFGNKEAQVVCRTLGFLGEATVLKNTYGSGIGPIWLDQVSCIGNESSLEQCAHWAWGEHNCDHKEDVSVRCSDRPANPNAEPTTTTTAYPEQEQVPEDDIDLYLYKVQRSSKALNQNKRCGQINEHALDEFNTNDEFARVVNGTKAVRGHHPWQASLRAKGRNGMSTHWCGAILITQMHVLTAAHCLIGYQKEGLFVRMGDHYSKIAEPSEIDSFIQNWYVHEEFRKGHHMNNDIGLIVLKSPVIFNDYIQPICLPSKESKYEEGMKCTISGWGSIKSGISTPSNNLKAAHVPIISQDVCKEPYVYGNAITDGMFCAGYLDEGVDACDGDSGGPLACTTPDGETLFGIISWGQHCGQANKPGVYVKVAHYLDWIMDKITFSLKSKKN